MTAALVFISIAALLIGPLFWNVAARQVKVRIGLHGFVLVSVLGLIALHVVPHAFLMAGWWVLPALLGGLLLPAVAEGLPHRRGGERQVERLTLVLVATALGLHAVMDGIALALPANHSHADAALHGHGSHGSGLSLALAVILHRIPVGFAIWWLIRPHFSRAFAITVIGYVALGTVMGAALTEPLLSLTSSEGMGIFQAFAAGALVHVLLHRPDFGPASGQHDSPASQPGLTAAVDTRPVKSDPRRLVRAELVGGAVGVAIVLLMLAFDPDDHAPVATWAERFVALALDMAPALLIGYLLAGVLAEWLSGAPAGYLAKGSSVAQTARGVAFGIPLPICSCGVVPIYRSLALAGVPATAALAFLVATPEIGIDSLLVSLPLLGLPFTVARVVAAVFVATVIGILIGRMVQRSEAAPPVPATPMQVTGPDPLDVRCRRALRVGLESVVDDTAVWILAGLAIAAMIEPAALASILGPFSLTLQVALFAIIGIPVYVCASGATPLAAMLIAGGVSPGAALAFLITGPATNVTTFGVVSAVHNRTIAFRFAALALLLAFLIGLATNAIIGADYAVPARTSLDEHSGPVHLIALALVIALFLWSIIRLGPTRFLHTLLHGFGHHHEHDGADDCCDHSHGHGHGHGHEGHNDRHHGCGHAPTGPQNPLAEHGVPPRQPAADTHHHRGHAHDHSQTRTTGDENKESKGESG
ncbi:MAG: hypothetical protein EA398_04400 [Deltaproteobacteria bacterium]|nr:MAG: hypothetical protein EA398_04400 [Deltaproteobacteria bacterium]